VHVKVIEAVGAPLVSLLERGHVHVTVGIIQTSQADNPFMESLPLSPLEFLAAYREPLEGSTGGDVDITRLAAYRLLLLDSTFYVRQTFDAACRLAGVKLDIFLESRAPHTLLALAEAGHGVAIIPSVLPMSRYRVRIARITHRRRPLQGVYAIVWDKRRPLPPYALEFCELLASHTRKVFAIARSRVKTGAAPS
jgi:DNA-binding transcriptional LysR family regulator